MTSHARARAQARTLLRGLAWTVLLTGAWTAIVVVPTPIALDDPFGTAFALVRALAAVLAVRTTVACVALVVARITRSARAARCAVASAPRALRPLVRRHLAVALIAGTAAVSLPGVASATGLAAAPAAGPAAGGSTASAAATPPPAMWRLDPHGTPAPAGDPNHPADSSRPAGDPRADGPTGDAGHTTADTPDHSAPDGAASAADPTTPTHDATSATGSPSDDAPSDSPATSVPSTSGPTGGDTDAGGAIDTDTHMLGGPAAAAETWTVARGEHLWSIAEQVQATRLGRAPTVEEIARHHRALIEANRSRLADPDNPDLIFAGQELIVPAAP